jgi:hypothetical protein
MLPETPPGTIDGQQLFHLEALSLERIYHRSTPYQAWDLGYWSTSHAWSGQSLYSIAPPSAAASKSHSR